jgi:hypothetical protein
MSQLGFVTYLLNYPRIVLDTVCAYKSLVTKPEGKSPRACPTVHGNSIITNVRTCRTHWSRGSQCKLKCGNEITGFTDGGKFIDSYYQFLKKIDKQSLNRPADCNAFVVTDWNLKSSSFSNKVCRRLCLKCDGRRSETRYRLSAKRTSPFKSAGASVHSSTGSRGVRNSGSNAGYTMFRGCVKSTGYPLHSPVSPSLPLPCVNACHHISTGRYKNRIHQKRHVITIYELQTDISNGVRPAKMFLRQIPNSLDSNRAKE